MSIHPSYRLISFGCVVFIHLFSVVNFFLPWSSLSDCMCLVFHGPPKAHFFPHYTSMWHVPHFIQLQPKKYRLKNRSGLGGEEGEMGSLMYFSVLGCGDLVDLYSCSCSLGPYPLPPHPPPPNSLLSKSGHGVWLWLWLFSEGLAGINWEEIDRDN